MQRIVTPQPADHGAVCGMINALCGRYRFLTAAPIGRSVLGRSLWGLTLGAGKQRVLMTAAFHGQEWLTSLVCLRLCEELCHALVTVGELDGWDVHRALTGRSLVFVPLVNPDGVEIALHGSVCAGKYGSLVRDAGGDEQGVWQANARGVDINHNFNAGWAQLQQAEREKGIVGPAARQYGGPAPESEPETAALTALCRRVAFRHVTALHSQGEEIYWEYGERTPPASKLLAMVMSAASGYAMAAPEGLASHGGFKDWFIEELGRPGFTIELGRGKNPLPVTELDSIYHKAREMLLIALFA